MVSYVFITLQLRSKNCFLNNHQTNSPHFMKKHCKAGWRSFHPIFCWKPGFRSSYCGPNQAKSWIFPARDISLLLWATYFNGWFAWWSCFFLSPGQNFSWSSLFPLPLLQPPCNLAKREPPICLHLSLDTGRLRLSFPLVFSSGGW